MEVFFEMNLYSDGTHAYAEVTRSFAAYGASKAPGGTQWSLHAETVAGADPGFVATPILRPFH